MTPVEAAILTFAFAVREETMGAGRVVDVTLDPVTFDRLAETMGMRVTRVIDDPYGGPMQQGIMFACAGGYVTVYRGV